MALKPLVRVTKGRPMRPLARKVMLPLLLAAATVGGVLPQSNVNAAPPCTPGENGCLPTPEQCATGDYNNFWPGDSAGRFAVCVGAADYIAYYSGGDATTMCGTVIVADHLVSPYYYGGDEYGSDPNDCLRSTTLSTAERTANLKHVSNQAPSEPSAANAQSDLAFWGKLAFAGNYKGVRIFDVSSAPNPKLVADLRCPASQNDVSVWEDVLVVSVDRPRTGPGCGSEALPADQQTNPTGFEGLRIFRISEIAAAAAETDDRVVQSVEPIATVPVDCGSHTNTLVPELDKNRVLVYVASTGYNPGPRCSIENAALFGYDPLHRKISIVEVALDAPDKARIISEPRIDAPVFEGHHGHAYGAVTNPIPRKTISCHDINVFLEIGLAAASCLSEGQLWDISDPAHPKTLEAVHIDNDNVEFWHSASFTWDGKTVVFSDESPVNTCGTGTKTGRLWFYEVADPSRPLGSFQIPRAEENSPCFAHNFNLMPVVGRDIAVMGAYGGGVSVVDFTYPDNAQEIAFYDFDSGTASDTWSAYWYNGYIYANDGLQWFGEQQRPHRGFDVFHLDDLAREGAKRFSYLNPQVQESLITGA